MWAWRCTVDLAVQHKLCKVVAVIYLSGQSNTGVRIKEKAAGEARNQL